MPKLSIIIPIYNVQDYITECLDSIAAQTYTTGVECILADDCGNDEHDDHRIGHHREEALPQRILLGFLQLVGAIRRKTGRGLSGGDAI